MGIKVGEYVRLYDYDLRDDCYVEGVVTAIDGDRYVIPVEQVVVSGVHDEFQFPPGHVVHAPVNGTRRIKVVERPTFEACRVCGGAGGDCIACHGSGKNTVLK